MTNDRRGFPWLAWCAARRRCDVEPPLESPAEEVTRLRDCLNDLVSIMALPAQSTAASRVTS